MSSSAALILSTLAFLLLILIMFGFFIVHQQTVAIVERFGKFLRTAEPGLRCRVPFVDQIAGYMNLRIQQLDVAVETKTQDNVFVQIRVSVQYRALGDRVYEAFYKLEKPALQIQAFVFDVVRAKVPSIALDDVFARKDEIAENVRIELQETMHQFGYEIIKALVNDIQPDDNVKQAMNEINTAQRLRHAAQERAEAEKIMRVKQAEAEAEANILHGKGIAGQRQAIIDGLSASMAELHKKSPELKSADIMQTILMIQYFDMLKDMGANSKTNTIFVSHSPQHVQDISQHLRETFLSPRPGE